MIATLGWYFSSSPFLKSLPPAAWFFVFPLMPPASRADLKNCGCCLIIIRFAVIAFVFILGRPTHGPVC